MFNEKSCYIFVFLAISLLPSCVFADGGFVTDNYSKEVYAPDQKVAIFWDGQNETMILSTKLQSSELANFGWIIPIQATNKPEVELGDVQIFYILSDYFKSLREEISHSMTLGIEEPDFDSIEVLETKKLGVYDITILRADNSDQLYRWLKVNNYRVNERAKDTLKFYTKKDFFFIAVKINLLNEYQSEVELLKKHKLLGLVSLATAKAPPPLWLKRGGLMSSLALARDEYDSFEEPHYAIAYSIIFNSLMNEPYPSGLKEYLGPVEYNKLKGEYSIDPNSFRKIKVGIKKLCKIMVDLKQGVAKPLEVTFKTKRPFFPLKISSMNGEKVKVTAYVFSKQPLKDNSGILEISRFKEMTRGLGIRKRVGEFLDIGQLRYVSKLTFEDDSSKFVNDVYFTEMNSKEIAEKTDSLETFFEAIRDGDIEYVKRYIRGVPDINGLRMVLYTPLYYAMMHKQKRIAEFLLDNGAQIDGSPALGMNPLSLAIYRKDINSVRLLLNRGTNINVSYETLGTQLHLATHCGSVEIVELLLDRGANINVTNGLNRTPLHIAAEEDNVGIVKLLVEQGGDIEARDHINATPLICAACSSNSDVDAVETVKYLLEKGANIDAEFMHGTALDCAKERGKTGSAAILSKAKAEQENQRNERVKQLLARAKANDDKVNGEIALQTLDELLSLKPKHQEALRMRKRIASYIGFSNSIGMHFVEIKPGEFLMGSQDDEKRDDDEQQHPVKITKGFYIGAFEVTQARWKSIMGSYKGGMYSGTILPEGDELPAVVTWSGAAGFCAKLSNKEGKQYRLPTEAEWEYACRAGTTYRFYSGKKLASDCANYNQNNLIRDPDNPGRRIRGPARMIPVGSFAPNKWGLHDMYGNAREWCLDCYSDYPHGRVLDPIGPLVGDKHIVRGGSWNSKLVDCRSANRAQSSGRHGFRVVLDSFGFKDIDKDSVPDWWDKTSYRPTANSIPIEEKPSSHTKDKKNLFVNAIAGNDKWDGLANVERGKHGPKATIRAAIESADEGDLILVADGTYKGPGNRDLDFKGKSIKLCSENGRDSCIIDCQGTSKEPHRAFQFSTGEQQSSIIQGFTIENGYADRDGGAVYCENGSSPSIINCLFRNNSTGKYGRGGAIHCKNSHVLIRNCEFTKNLAGNQGGGAIAGESNITVTDCRFIENKTSVNGGAVSSGGQFENCTFISNTAQAGGAIHSRRDKLLINNSNFNNNSATAGYGGAIYADSKNTIIIGSTISQNKADSHGGGIYLDGEKSMVNKCKIVNNYAEGNGGGINIFRWHGRKTMITNCFIAWNKTSEAYNGGGIYVNQNNTSISNCTITDNITGDGGGVYCSQNSGCKIANSILWKNQARRGNEIAVGSDSFSTIIRLDYCLVDGGENATFERIKKKEQKNTSVWGEGVIRVDPMLEQDGSLKAGSPCIDAGDPNSSYAGKTDIIGVPRIINGRIDIGAYEFSKQ